MKEEIKGYRFYYLVLLGAIYGSLFMGGMCVMIFDSGHFTLPQVRLAALAGLPFPSLVVADLLFLRLMRRTGRWLVSLCAFLLPLLVEALVLLIFDGIIPLFMFE